MTGLSLTERLAQHLMRPVVAEVTSAARLHLLDWAGCVAGALTSPVAAPVRGMEGPAALRAGWLGNVLEMDDVHRSSILHPGPVIWPVALAGEATDMPTLLVAAVCGYEATISIGATFDQHHYAHWYNSATAGVFGAATTAARLAGGDAATMVSALGLSGSVAGGLWRMRHEPVTAKQWQIAHAVATGRHAADSARQGITGPRFILEGEQGLYPAMTETPRPMELGEGWRLAQVSFKPWGACRHAHPAIDAALELRAAGAFAETDGPVTVATYRDALTFCDRPHPQTVHEAKFSLQHAVAVVMARGEPQLADFEPDAISALADVRARVRVVEDADISARFPQHYGARVSAAGHTADLIDTRGDPERPLSRDGVIAKARTLMTWGGVAADADAMIAACLEGDDPGAVVAVLERWL